MVPHFTEQPSNSDETSHLEWMPAQNTSTLLDNHFIRLLKQIKKSIAVGAVQAVCILTTRHGHLFNVLAQLHARAIVHFRQL